MKKRKYKKSLKFGKWTLSSYLGGGGNGEVWKCIDLHKNEGAIKILKSVKPKAYARFLDETNTLEKNSDIDGVIPVIDKFLPEDIKDNTPYYVMPVAAPAETILKDKNIDEIVGAILQICKTLSQLHERGISHRDIKPANLLYNAEKFVLADFGLVDYPDKKDISFKNEEIGPKWTMAPEMRRESHKADGLKADIYSLAKTLWIFLTKNTKGFDGQYSTASIIHLQQFHKDTYTSPIDSLLTACTDNDPNLRPTANEFIEALEDWKVLNADFHERNLEQWFEIQTKLFPTAFPKRVIWEDIHDIIKILKTICLYDNLNHLFYPSGGGNDLEDVRLASEEGCIELDFQLISIVKPKRLIFESFGYDPEWNYFRLETYELEPAVPIDVEEGEEPYHIRYNYEAVSELYPGEYYPYHILEDRDYYSEQYPINEYSRQVTRYLRGSFVIFNKRSPYNLESSTYDARHDKMDTEEFRAYIQRNVDRFKEMQENKPLYEKMVDVMDNRRRRSKK